jgi:FkbM family methyltransferase
MVVSHGALRAYGRSFLRLASEREYRRVSALSIRYLLHPRRRPSSVRIGGRRFVFPDAASFLSAYEEIFVDEIYKFRPESAQPVILDLGANVGVSVLYFKRNYPGARISAFEPDPSIFSYLKRNVATHELADVELHNAAVWTEDCQLHFASDGADGGHLTPASTTGTQVRAYSIRSLLNVPVVDFLKMDIEGAENSVLPACADLLPRVRNIFVEYHSRANAPQQLHSIIDSLAQAGFRLTINSVKHRPTPLLPRTSSEEFDLQLNIFGART